MVNMSPKLLKSFIKGVIPLQEQNWSSVCVCVCVLFKTLPDAIVPQAQICHQKTYRMWGWRNIPVSENFPCS